jgi:putative transposase
MYPGCTVRGYRATDAIHQQNARHPNLRWTSDVTAPNPVWVGNIRYFRIAGCWWNRAMVRDECSRRILAWSLTRRRTSAVTCAVLAEAARRRPSAGAIFHRHRGAALVPSSRRTACGRARVCADPGTTRTPSRSGTPTRPI